MYIFSKESCKEIDNECIESIGMPSIVLMENAGERISKKIEGFSEEFCIVTGVGNNGGDGLVIARKLLLLNKKVYIFIVGDLKKGTKDFNINLDILKNMETNVINIKEENINVLRKNILKNTVVIDALLGVGLNRDVTGIYRDVINIINTSNRVLSIDVPSGLDSNRGVPLGVAVKAIKTYTIEVYKEGYVKNSAIEYLGDIEVVPIDIPKKILESKINSGYILQKEDYIYMIPKRKKDAHKGDFGKVGIFAGSKDFIGAAYIVSEAIVKMGSGLVTILAKREIASILKARVIEAMVQEYDNTYEIERLERFDTIAIGPGMGMANSTKEIVEKVIESVKCPIVIDADGLNILSSNIDILKKKKSKIVLTPHLGEMSRLTGIDIEKIEEDKINIAKKFAKKWGVIVLLKGYRTVITDGTKVYINITGNSKMASGGMGDCLTGIITSLIGQGVEPFKAAILGAYIHGYAGEKVGTNRYSVSARDIIINLPEIIEELLCGK